MENYHDLLRRTLEQGVDQFNVRTGKTCRTGLAPASIPLMCWEQWLAKFEDMEHKSYGSKLEGEERHPTLYDLFKDGYSPERAFQLVRTAARLDKIMPLLPPVVLLGGIGAVFMLKGLLFGGPWEGGAIVVTLSGAFVLWVRHTVKWVAYLAANPTPTDLHVIK